MSDQEHSEVLALTAGIVAAHVGRNQLHTEALPGLISSVYATLSRLGHAAPEAPGRPEPAVPIKKSVFPDYIVCLEDGRKMKMLKRHLATTYSMTPAEYRARWGLPADYPMTAPSYAEQRSVLAREIGLGRHDGKAAPAKRGRPKKAA